MTIPAEFHFLDLAQAQVCPSASFVVNNLREILKKIFVDTFILHFLCNLL